MIKPGVGAFTVPVYTDYASHYTAGHSMGGAASHYMPGRNRITEDRRLGDEAGNPRCKVQMACPEQTAEYEPLAPDVGESRGSRRTT